MINKDSKGDPPAAQDDSDPSLPAYSPRNGPSSQADTTPKPGANFVSVHRAIGEIKQSFVIDPTTTNLPFVQTQPRPGAHNLDLWAGMGEIRAEVLVVQQQEVAKPMGKTKIHASTGMGEVRMILVSKADCHTAP